MKPLHLILILSVLQIFLFNHCNSQNNDEAIDIQKINFLSYDGLTITADWYHAGYDNPVFILCHQAGYSRGEYNETAANLLSKGYNCIAIDQRSGKECNGVTNETATRAKEQNLPTEYLDAEQDIVAAIDYITAELYPGKKIILVGSSYSASLVLKIAVMRNDILAVVAFSPGEYFGEELNLKQSIANLYCPVFIACSAEEATSCNEIKNAAMGSTFSMSYHPEEGGYHGSKMLWKENNGCDIAWQKLNKFLEIVFENETGY